jgi:hypothetical protein
LTGVLGHSSLPRPRACVGRSQDPHLVLPLPQPTNNTRWRTTSAS